MTCPRDAVILAMSLPHTITAEMSIVARLSLYKNPFFTVARNFDWVQKQDKASVPYIILGDFNHRLSAPYNAMTQKLANATTEYAALENTTQALIGCHPYYPAPIDHILVGKLSSAYQSEEIMIVN